MVRRAEDKTKEARTVDPKDSVRSSSDPEHIIDQSDSHNFTHADGDDTEIVSTEMDDGACDDQCEKAGDQSAEGHEPEHRNVEVGVENSRRVGSHGIEGGVPEVKEARMTYNQIQTESKNGIDADIVENVNPVGIEEQG